MAKSRNTDRKQFIQFILTGIGGTPLVLEDLRWRVFKKELAEEKEPITTMSESFQKSFNRTLRTFLPSLAPELRIHKIESGKGWTAGLLAKVAVFRLDNVVHIDKFLAASPSLHFWTNSRTADVWDEISDGEIEVRNEDLLPEGAPDRLESLYPFGSRWPRSSIERQRGLGQLGPKWIKRPLVCVKVCIQNSETPEEADVLAIIRMPTNQPLSVIGPEVMGEAEMKKLRMVPWALYQTMRGVTRKISTGKFLA